MFSIVIRVMSLSRQLSMEGKYYCCVFSVIVVLFCLCFLQVHSLRSELSITRIFAQTGDAPVTRLDPDGCGCGRFNCGCCAHLEFKKIYLNHTVCVNITYLPDQYGVSLTASVDGVIYFNRTVSLRNPPALCFGVPYLKKLASLCVQLYDLEVSNHTLSGCVRVLAELEGLIVDRCEIGCFRIPPRTAGFGSTSTHVRQDARTVKDMRQAVRTMMNVRQAARMMKDMRQDARTVKNMRQDARTVKDMRQAARTMMDIYKVTGWRQFEKLVNT